MRTTQREILEGCILVTTRKILNARERIKDDYEVLEELYDQLNVVIEEEKERGVAQ